jgi:hypothetical protein
MNDSFRSFVREAEPPEQIAAWERSDPHDTWSRVGTPLYMLAAVALALLLFTEQGLFTGVLAMGAAASNALRSIRAIYATAQKSVVVAPT